MAKNPKVGVYRDIKHEVYSAWPAVNHSILKELERSPMHARYVKTVPRAPTPALEMGDATHAAVLEPDRWEAEYVEAPSGDRRTKAGRDAWNEVQNAHPKANPLRPQDYSRILAMKDAVHAHPIAHQLVADAALVEASFLWKDGETGQLRAA
jgi:exodeoxyribonuclease VIII